MERREGLGDEREGGREREGGERGRERGEREREGMAFERREISSQEDKREREMEGSEKEWGLFVDFNAMSRAIEKYSEMKNHFERANRFEYQRREEREREKEGVLDVKEVDDDLEREGEGEGEEEGESESDVIICSVCPHKRPRLFIKESSLSLSLFRERIVSETSSSDGEVPNWWWPASLLKKEIQDFLRNRQRLTQSLLPNYDKDPVSVLSEYVEVRELRSISATLIGLLDGRESDIPTFCRNRHYLFPKGRKQDLITFTSPLPSWIIGDTTMLTVWMFFIERLRQQHSLQLALPPAFSPSLSHPIRVPLGVLGCCLSSPAYERLEFLGDASLKVYVSAVLVDLVSCHFSLSCFAKDLAIDLIESSFSLFRLFCVLFTLSLTHTYTHTHTHTHTHTPILAQKMTLGTCHFWRRRTPRHPCGIGKQPLTFGVISFPRVKRFRIFAAQNGSIIDMVALFHLSGDATFMEKRDRSGEGEIFFGHCGGDCGGIFLYLLNL